MKCLERFDNIPTNVRHHSIVGVGNYSEYDGLHEGGTDAKALSIGISQWKHVDEDGVEEISAKVFRYNGKRWSRQSEELPLHRCFDLCILIVQALQRSTNGDFFKTGEKCIKPHVVNDKELKLIKRFYDKYKDDYLIEKMNELKDLLELFLISSER